MATLMLTKEAKSMAQDCLDMIGDHESERQDWLDRMERLGNVVSEHKKRISEALSQVPVLVPIDVDTNYRGEITVSVDHSSAARSTYLPKMSVEDRILLESALEELNTCDRERPVLTSRGYAATQVPAEELRAYLAKWAASKADTVSVPDKVFAAMNEMLGKPQP